MQELSNNIGQINNIESIIGILDRSLKNNIKLSRKLMDQLLQQALNIIGNSIDDDVNVDRIMRLFMVLAINKIERSDLYQVMIDFIQKNIKKF